MIPSNLDIIIMRKARESIGTIIEKESDEITSGISKGDPYDYGKRCGHISGLRDALTLLTEIATQQMSGDRSD